MDDDNADLIDLILKETEESTSNYDTSKYNIDEVLKETELSSGIKTLNDIIPSSTPSQITSQDNLDSIINSINQKETPIHQVTETTQKEIQPSIKTNEPVAPIKEELTLPQCSNLIDLVEYLELGVIKEKIEKTKNNFHLFQHSIKSTLKVNSLEIEPQIDVSRAIFKVQNVFITCMTARGDLIVVGYSVGEIKIYSLKDKKLIKTLSPDKANTNTVNCIDLSSDGLFLLAGHSNSNIAFWEINSGSCKLTISGVLYSSCLAVKFYKVDGKFYHCFASDADGNLAQIVIKNILMFWRVDSKKILYTQNKNPTFLIKLITFTNEQRKAFPSITSAAQTAIFGSLQNIQLYSIENNFKQLWIGDKPPYIKDNNPPDASIGIGKPPIDMSISSDTIKPQLLLAISWGKIIYVYMVPVIKKILAEPTQLGYFINTSQIYRMGFLTSSLVYFFDATKFIKVIDTRQINIGDVNIVKGLNEPEIPPKNNEAQLDDGRLVDPEIKPQFVQDKKGQPCAFYLHSIVENENLLHVMGKRTLYNGKLLNWENCLNTLKHDTDEEWMDLLIKGMNIYQFKMPALADIPQDEQVRKSVLRDYLEKSINQYVIFCINNKRSGVIFQDDVGENKYMGECISKIIEFCIEIESVHFLIDTIEKKFESKDYGDLFLAELEPFILCDKIKNFELSTDIIIKIIDLYRKNKNYDLLSQILIHLNIHSIDNDIIKSKCEEMSLLSPLIYIYNNGKQEDYFMPVTKLFDQYIKAFDIESGQDFYSYYDKKKDISGLKNTKQYIGYKILWYIKMCINGKKFPDIKMDVNNNKFKKAISQITYWLLTPRVFYDFVKFDTANYFDILNQIFSKEDLYNILEEASKTSDKISNLAMLYVEDNKINDVSPVSLVEFLVNQCKKTRDETIQLYSYEFVARSSNLVDHNKALAIETTKMLFNAYKTTNPTKHHLVSSKSQDDLITFANDIINLICNSNKFTVDDYKIMLSQCEETQFHTVMLFLYKKTHDYHQSFELYLKEDALIPNRHESLFSWINLTLYQLKDKDKNEFNKLKTDIFGKVCTIGKISVEQLASIVNCWFADQKNLILMNLEKEQKVQLAYVELLLKDITKELQENENMLDEDHEKIEDILKMHIKLLCKENRKNEILPNLIKIPLYPLDECLKIVKQYDVLDATIYLYRQTGAFKEALKLSMDTLSNIFQRLIENLGKSKSEFNDNIDTMKKKDFHANLAICIEVCEKSPKSEEDLWFTLLDKLYMFFRELNVNSIRFKENNINAFMQLEEQLSQDIKDLLEKMTSFVGLKRIINKVTDSNTKAELKEFKDLLIKMLTSYSNLTKILESAKQLLTNSVLINIDEFIKIKNYGSGFNVTTCSDCKKDLQKSWRSEDVIVFYCGHIVHEHCVYKDDKTGDIVCKICRSNEIEDSITSIGGGKKKKEKENEVENVNELNNKIEKNEDKKEMFRKLKNFDKKSHQKSKILIDNSIDCLKNEIAVKKRKDKEKKKRKKSD